MMKQSRGLRNNNPLNIRHGVSRWEGRATEQTDPDFVTFRTMAMGYRAAWKLLDTYMLRLLQARMAFNVVNIINRWAPESDGNNPAAYITAVMSLCDGKIGGHENLMSPTNVLGREKLRLLLAAMTCVENGIKMSQVPTDAIDHGYELAFHKL